MKHFTIGKIFCKCSVRMNLRGLIIHVYEKTGLTKDCPNCGKNHAIIFAGRYFN